MKAVAGDEGRQREKRSWDADERDDLQLQPKRARIPTLARQKLRNSSKNWKFSSFLSFSLFIKEVQLEFFVGQCYCKHNFVLKFIILAMRLRKQLLYGLASNKLPLNFKVNVFCSVVFGISKKDYLQRLFCSSLEPMFRKVVRKTSYLFHIFEPILCN